MKQLLVMLLLLCSVSVLAQDVIVKKDGSTVVCRVVELTATEITYKKWSDLNGSNYVMERSAASVINYENGKREEFSSVQNQYLPGNQNNGVQQYNDKALLGLDDAAVKPYKKARNLRTFGWIAGGVLIAAGVAQPLLFYSSNEWDDTNCLLPSLGCMAAGLLTTAGCLIAANKIEKEANRLQVSTLYQQNYQLPNGSSLSIGADLLDDHTIGSNTLGLGLRYNF